MGFVHKLRIFYLQKSLAKKEGQIMISSLLTIGVGASTGLPVADNAKRNGSHQRAYPTKNLQNILIQMPPIHI